MAALKAGSWCCIAERPNEQFRITAAVGEFQGVIASTASC